MDYCKIACYAFSGIYLITSFVLVYITDIYPNILPVVAVLQSLFIPVCIELWLLWQDRILVYIFACLITTTAQIYLLVELWSFTQTSDILNNAVIAEAVVFVLAVAMTADSARKNIINRPDVLSEEMYIGI